MDEITKLGLIADICRVTRENQANAVRELAYWLINHIVDPQPDRKLQVTGRQRFTQLLKKDPVLWNNLKPFLENANAECICNHSAYTHQSRADEKGNELYEHCNYKWMGVAHNQPCKCKIYVQKPL